MAVQDSLFSEPCAPDGDISSDQFISHIQRFTWKARETTTATHVCRETSRCVPVFTNEFWTSRQRAAHSLHEISYRACFKPQLPRFFIAALSHPDDVVYDPFAGRGTTLIEAALRARRVAGSDVNPLTAAIILPRLEPPMARDVAGRLSTLKLQYRGERPEDLLVFYHPDTLSEICALREYLIDRASRGTLDAVDAWIRMVAVNRLTGHSSGFFSVYTLPPNQALAVEAQRKINADRRQVPPRRDIRAIIARKTASLLADVDDATLQALSHARPSARFQVGSCTETNWEPAIFQLIVTSPPFLDVVDYVSDNWLRCWFCGIPAADVAIELHRGVIQWGSFIERAFAEFARVLKPGGFVAFEVGEVRRGTIPLDEVVVPRGVAAGLSPVCILVNDQAFTKTANIWGVSNNAKGTNTNRIVVFQKPRA
jgi:SAM-dependent methyltransferase